MRKSSGTAASGREKAYAYLRENILIDPEVQGKFLNEQELAAEIGVSRTPVREALLLLVSDGLVELIPQRGAYVPPVTGREMSELMELRGVLEAMPPAWLSNSAAVSFRSRLHWIPRKHGASAEDC